MLDYKISDITTYGSYEIMICRNLFATQTACKILLIYCVHVYQITWPVQESNVKWFMKTYQASVADYPLHSMHTSYVNVKSAVRRAFFFGKWVIVVLFAIHASLHFIVKVNLSAMK